MTTRIRTVLAWTAFLLAAGSSSPAHAVFFAQPGFEDDVDLIVDPSKEFLVVPVEAENGTSARLRIYDLTAATGNVVGLSADIAVVGWENGVDPIIVDTGGGNRVVLAPTEGETGGTAQLLILVVNNAGAVVSSVTKDLNGLGFEDDGDFVPAAYPDFGAFIPLETENGSAAGILAVNTKLAACPSFSMCTVLSSDGRATDCESDLADPTGLLKGGFVDGVDGVFYRLSDRARLAIPAAGAANGPDLLFVDFSFDCIAGPPAPVPPFVTSVKAVNAAGVRPTPFPGFERDVDIAVMSFDAINAPTGNNCLPLDATCTDDDLFWFPLLVPVEDPVADTGDLYLINGCNGVAYWRYQLDAPPATAPPILGYEEGVDVVPWCNLVAAPNDLVVVPAESECGGDADLLMVDLATGAFHASLESASPPIEVLGYEKGVEPQLWTPVHLLVPVDDEHGRANLLVVSSNAVLLDAAENPLVNPSNVIFGYERSVDPVSMKLPNPDRTLYVPVEKQDQLDADLRIFPGPPPSLFGTSISFEAVNPGKTISGYERDVDAQRLNQQDGYNFVYVAEETEGGTAARLRVHPFPASSSVCLLLPTEGAFAPRNPNLYFINPAGSMLQENPDVLGYETGLDPTSPAGDTLSANPPGPYVTLGFDADGDNTLTMENSYPGDVDGDGHADLLDCAPREGGVWAPPTEVGGLMVSKLIGGIARISWTSQDPTAGPDTCYDVASGKVLALRADMDYSDAACFADGLPDTPADDPDAPAPADGFYYHVRAQNVCGTGTYGPPALDTVAPPPCD